jgi:hypothetical protein
MKYRKMPVVIEATQWWKNGDHPDDYSSLFAHRVFRNEATGSGDEARRRGGEGGVVRYFLNPEVSGEKCCQHCRRIMHEHGWIDTLEGGHIVCPGDYVITGVKGERYPCKPDIFEATYEALERQEAK